MTSLTESLREPVGLAIHIDNYLGSIGRPAVGTGHLIDAINSYKPITALEQPTNDYVRMRLAQIASGDYKACGHTAEQVAADALLHLAKQPTNDVERVREGVRKAILSVAYQGVDYHELDKAVDKVIAALTQKNEG